MRYFDMRLFFLTTPKPLKQYTLFKKEYPFRSPLWPGSPRAGSGGVGSPNWRLIYMCLMCMNGMGKHI